MLFHSMYPQHPPQGTLGGPYTVGLEPTYYAINSIFCTLTRLSWTTLKYMYLGLKTGIKIGGLNLILPEPTSTTDSARSIPCLATCSTNPFYTAKHQKSYTVLTCNFWSMLKQFIFLVNSSSKNRHQISEQRIEDVPAVEV